MKFEQAPISEVKKGAKEAVAFAVLRGISNAIWIGGTAAGIAAQRKLGVDPFLACSTIAASVTAVEYAGTNVAVRMFERDELDPDEIQPSEIDGNENKIPGFTKELFAAGYSAWSGAMSAVEVNNTAGLPNTSTRRLTQSAIYGASVSLWASPLPGFKQGQDGILEAAEYAIENPVQGATVGAIGSVAIYGALRGWKNFRESRKARKAEAKQNSQEL